MVLRFSVFAGRAQGRGAEGEACQVVDIASGGTEICIGRQPGAAIELPFPAVSARHARVFREADGYRVEDLGSVNGSALGDRRLVAHAPLPFAAGETLTCAGVRVRFDGELPDPAVPPSPDGTETLARRLVHDVFAACPPGETVRLVGVSGPGAGRELALVSCARTLLVGRDEHCDLVLPDEDVSREHAAFQRTAAGVTVQDLKSKNGVEVEGQRIEGYRRLHDGEVVRIGETTLRLVDPEDRYLRQVQEAGAGQNCDSLSPVSTSVTPVGAGVEAVATGPSPAKVAPSVGEADRRRADGVFASGQRDRLPLLASALAAAVLLLLLGLVLALAFGCQV